MQEVSINGTIDFISHLFCFSISTQKHLFYMRGELNTSRKCVDQKAVSANDSSNEDNRDKHQ